MATEILVDQDAVLVEQSNVVIAETVVDAKVHALDPIMQIYPEEFVLSSGGLYGGNGLIGAVPDWILNAVHQELTTGTGNLTSVVLDVQTLLGSLQTGVSQAIASLNTLTSSTASLTTGLQSQVDVNNAAAINSIATKVTAAEAQALVASGISSTFGGNVNAYIGAIASTYTDVNSAIAQDVQLLTASVNGVQGSISDISLLTVETVLNPLWVDDGLLTDPDTLGHPRYITRAKATKQLQVDANGVISGILLESGATSAVTIQADQFKLIATGQSVASRNPFTVDALTGQIVFNGVVSFNSVTDAPAMVAANTNINVSTNLVPNAGWGVGGNGDYQFVATPTYYRMLGAGIVAEDTLLLNLGDEVYTPYITDMTLSYKLSYSFKGAKIGSFITVIGVAPTSVDIIPAGVTVDPLKWYNVQIAILPNGTTGGSLFGFIQESATLNVIATIPDAVLGVGIEKFLMGFVPVADTYISRVSIETITSNTLSSVPVTAANLNTALASTNTVIDGAHIATGSITAGSIAANAITADKIMGDAINGRIIEGSIIKGASIEGSVIKSSWIDYSSTGDLTNWQFYTPATIPTAYAANFAHNNTTGALIVDSLGYVRLPGMIRMIPVYTSATNGTIASDQVYPYDSYTINTTRRVISSSVTITFTGETIIHSGYNALSCSFIFNKIPVSVSWANNYDANYNNYNTWPSSVYINGALVFSSNGIVLSYSTTINGVPFHFSGNEGTVTGVNGLSSISIGAGSYTIIHDDILGIFRALSSDATVFIPQYTIF